MCRCYCIHEQNVFSTRDIILIQPAIFNKKLNLTHKGGVFLCLFIITPPFQMTVPYNKTISWPLRHTHTLPKRQQCSKILILHTCGVSFPTLCVIGSFITTSTLQASFSLGMENCRSSSDRKTDWPFITFTPRLTLIKEEQTHLRITASSGNKLLFSKGFILLGKSSSRQLVKVLNKRGLLFVLQQSFTI